MKFKLMSCYAIDTLAECIINSANGLLMQDSSGAGRIRELSKDCSKEEFVASFKKIDIHMQHYILKRAKDHGWKPRFANKTAAELLFSNKKNFELGEIVYDKELSKDLNKKIIHAVTCNYDITKDPVQRVPGNEDTIIQSYTKAFQLAIKLGCKSIAFPIPIARPSYGLNPEKSYKAVREAVKTIGNEDITLYVCFDNDETKKLLHKLQ